MSLNNNLIISTLSVTNNFNNKAKIMKNLRGLLAVLAVLLGVFVSSAQTFPIRINCGGSATTTNGVSWDADQYYLNAELNYPGHSNLTLGEPYESIRYSKLPTGTPTFEYNIPVPDGNYEVILHFVEPYYVISGAAGTRIFDVFIENGQHIVQNLNILAEVGPDAIYSQTYPVTVTDNNIEILFISENGKDPVINAIEIHEVDDSDTIPPSGLFDLTATPFDNSVQLDWSGATDNIGIAGYYIYEGISSSNWNLVHTVVGDLSTYTVLGLSLNTPYTFNVVPYDAAGNVGSNTSTNVTTLAGDMVPPTPPTLSTTGKGETTVDLSWGDEATDNVGVNGYRIYRSGNIQASPFLVSTLRNFQVTGLTPNTPYDFTIKALDAIGNLSTNSNVINVTTNSSADNTAPQPPNSITAGTPTSSSVPLSWTASTDPSGIKEYRIYMDDNGDDIYEPRMTSNGAGLSATVTGLPSGVIYRFKVTAVDNSPAANESVLSTSFATASTELGDGYDPNFELRINAGGSIVTVDGDTFITDDYFTLGAITSTPNTVLSEPYNRERYGNSGSMSYNIPLADGQYRVVLSFAELHWGATNGGPGGSNRRVFDVNIEGGTNELENYDVFVQAGGAETLKKETFDVQVTGGELNIDFSKSDPTSSHHPQVTAIEVLGSNFIDPGTPNSTGNIAIVAQGQIDLKGQQPNIKTVTHNLGYSPSPELIDVTLYRPNQQNAIFTTALIGNITNTTFDVIFGTTTADDIVGAWRIFGPGTGGAGSDVWSTSGTDAYYSSGNVGIGVANPDAPLTVKGQIHSTEVKVDMLGALVPDYVFLKDYDLKTLEEVEKSIKELGHLPKIPSAKELEENGMELKAMNLSLLEKVEELTLYIIQQHKSQKQLEERIQVLETQK